MQNDSKNNTNSTSASVLMINAQGIMISVCGQDYFLSYNRIPWMRDAAIKDVLNIQMCGNEAVERAWKLGDEIWTTFDGMW